LKLLSRLLALGSTLVPDLSHDEKLFSSPLGKAQTTLTAYQQGDRLRFKVALDPDYIAPSLLGYYNVRRIEIWRKDASGGADLLVGRDALNGEKDFTFEWPADRGGLTKDNVIAVIEPVFGEGFGFKLGPVEGWSGIRQGGALRDQIGRALAVDPDGNVAVVGYSFDPIGSVLPSGAADSGFWKLDPLGNELDHGSLGSTGDDIPMDIKRAPDGHYYVCGYSYGGDLDGGGAPAPIYSWLAQLDATGKKRWVYKWGEARDPAHGLPVAEEAVSIAIGPNGEVYVASVIGAQRTSTALGTTDMFISTVDPPDHGDVVLSRFDPGGNRHWRTRDARQGYQSGAQVAVDSGGNVAVVSPTYRDLNPTNGQYLVNQYQMGAGVGFASGIGIWTFDPGSGSVTTRSYIKIPEKDVFRVRAVYVDGGTLTIAGSTNGAFQPFANRGGFDLA
jgi:hypothetical protein